jgi:hypothetical protein
MARTGRDPRSGGRRAAVAAAEAAVTDTAVPTGTRSIDDGATRALTHPVS